MFSYKHGFVKFSNFVCDSKSPALCTLFREDVASSGVRVAISRVKLCKLQIMGFYFGLLRIRHVKE